MALMNCILQWLKYIRLHKYSNYLCNISYDDLISLTDEKLMEMKITLGARKKLLGCIDKLIKRKDRIKELLTAITPLLDDKNNDKKSKKLELDNILNELIEMSIGPIKQQDNQLTSLSSLKGKLLKESSITIDENEVKKEEETTVTKEPPKEEEVEEEEEEKEEEETVKNDDFYQLFLEILGKIQSILVSETNSDHHSNNSEDNKPSSPSSSTVTFEHAFSSQQYPIHKQDEPDLNQLILKFNKIIDNLFLSKVNIKIIESILKSF
jgi:hypothetical protein